MIDEHSSRLRYHRYRQAFVRQRGSEPPAPPAASPAAAGQDAAPRRERRRAHLQAYRRCLWPHRYALVALLGLNVMAAGGDMMVPLFLRFIIDRVLLDNTLDTAARLLRFNLAAVTFVAALVVFNGIGVFKDYRQATLTARLTLSLRRTLFGRLLRLPLPALWEMKIGGILSRLTGDIEITTGMLQSSVIAPGVAVIRLGVAVTVLVLLNWRLAVMAGLAVPVVTLLSVATSRRVRPIYRSAREDLERLDGRVAEAFSGIRVVRAFQRERRELRDYMVGRHTVVRKELFARRLELGLAMFWSVTLATLNIGLLWYGGYLTIMGRATLGDIMAFQWYLVLLTGPLAQLSGSFAALQRSLAAMERVFALLAMADDKPDRPGARAAPADVREIRFEQVDFAYREGHPVIRGLDITVPGGAVVALVGRSGAGKTTITDLVARFHDPTRGRVLLNGTDIRDLRLATYRRLLAIVQQETFLFDGSVRDNIAYGRSDATDVEVEDAARRAHAHEFIEQLPQRYGTPIGERGVKLSGGQCQRLSIARAILAAPRILVLDEATSNLDTESEQLIQASMASLLVGRTTFVIAHRLSTIRRADMILLLDEGRILERGTHDELMAARGAYHAMVERQRASTDDVEIAAHH